MSAAHCKTFVLFTLCMCLSGASTEKDFDSNGRRLRFLPLGGLASKLYQPSKCSALVSFSIRTVGQGSCSVRGTASCKTYTGAVDSVEELVDSLFSLGNEGLCATSNLEVLAEAIGTAVASVWTEALTKIECNGAATGCGYAVGNGEAFASAFVRALSSSIVAAAAADDIAFCEAEITSLGTAIAKAAVQSQTVVCLSGRGSLKAFQGNFMRAVVKIVARALSKAFATACGTGVASTQCIGEGGSATTASTIGSSSSFSTKSNNGFASAIGAGAVTAQSLRPCTEAFACCLRSAFPCPCPLCSGDKYVFLAAWSPSGKVLTHNGKQCYCPALGGK